MINFAQPIHVILPLDDMYDRMSDLVDKVGEYDFPFSIKAFADFMEDVVGAIVPDRMIDHFPSAVWQATMYVGAMYATDHVTNFFNEIRVQLVHLNLPMYPVAGYAYRFYITGDLTMHLFYEHTSSLLTVVNTHTRDDILQCIENGDYISEKLRRTYGV